MSAPEPLTVKVPALKFASPARPTAPMSASVQPGGNVFGGLIVKLTVVVWVRLPLVPVTVTVAVPVAAVPLAVNVSVLVLAVPAGLNEAVTPAGNPAADRLTLP